MNLNMKIKNVKCISNIEFSFPLEPGIYAITGENGSGKSTLISCASTVFYHLPMNEFFGKPNNSKIEFELDDAKRQWSCNGVMWRKKSSSNRMKINGFYEGSVIFGNRFKDTDMSIINLLDSVSNEDLDLASEYVRKNLGMILHDDENYYDELFSIKKEKADKMKLSKVTYFIKSKNNELVNQARMSTGENLLLSILHSLEIIRRKRTNRSDGRPCIVFLDEIELALHSSALRRLIIFLKEISKEIDSSIFFSTHSIELLREIKPQCIYYLSINVDNSIRITNPCYPAYATRNLYGDDGYGNDIVILVEDDLSKMIIEKLLVEKDLMKNIRIKILPTGGWTNTIIMAYDITSSNLLQKGTKLAVILDQDIKSEVPHFISNHKKYSGIKPDYLPISSLEKFLKENLYDRTNGDLFSYLDTYLFQKTPLERIIQEYKNNNEKDDIDGKVLYGYFLNEIKSMRKDREDLADLIVRFIINNNNIDLSELEEYLLSKIKE